MSVGEKGVTKGYMDVIKDMSIEARTTIRSFVGEISEFPITMGCIKYLLWVLTYYLGHGWINKTHARWLPIVYIVRWRYRSNRWN